MIVTASMLESLSTAMLANAERQLQESEGRIPPLSQRQAYDGYGRKRVDEWVAAGLVKPVRDGQKWRYLHSELEMALQKVTIAVRHTDGNLY